MGTPARRWPRGRAALRARLGSVLSRVRREGFRELEPGCWLYKEGRGARQSLTLRLDLTGRGDHYCPCMEGLEGMDHRVAADMLCDHVLAAIVLSGQQWMVLDGILGIASARIFLVEVRNI